MHRSGRLARTGAVNVERQRAKGWGAEKKEARLEGDTLSSNKKAKER